MLAKQKCLQIACVFTETVGETKKKREATLIHREECARTKMANNNNKRVKVRAGQGRQGETP